MPYIQFSYSSLKTFNTCPKQYEHLYILKDVPREDNDASIYGKEVHSAIEEYIRDGKPLPAAYERFKDMVDPVLAWDGERHVELKMAVGPDLHPCDFFDPNYFVRGVADLVVVNGEKGRALDWKTGKSSRYADIKQLELMALLMFAHFPQVKEVAGQLVFLVAQQVVPKEGPVKYYRENAMLMWRNWIYNAVAIEMAIEKTGFNPKPNNLCRQYCPVTSCTHNGRNE
jgi:hypothetical protein